MEDDVLDKVMEAEREIAGRLEEEKRRVARWLDEVRAETDERVEAEQRRLREESDRAAGEALSRAREDAGRRKAEASERAERLGNLSDERLREVVMGRLAAILPDKSR